MKIWIPMIILLLSVSGLCIWDGIHTQKVFEKLTEESSKIYHSILTTEISNENLQKDIFELNDYWTKKMDTLCISISRKDLQPVSDYLQYLYSAAINENQEEAITYSRLLYYNVIGLNETTGINFVNLL